MKRDPKYVLQNTGEIQRDPSSFHAESLKHKINALFLSANTGTV